MKNNWQKDLHDRLGSYQKDEPQGLLEDIRKEMADVNGGYRRGSKSSGAGNLRRIAYAAAASSAVLLAGYAIYCEYAQNGQKPSEIAKVQTDRAAAKPSGNSSIAADAGNDISEVETTMQQRMSTASKPAFDSVAPAPAPAPASANLQYADALNTLKTATGNIGEADADGPRQTDAAGGKENTAARDKGTAYPLKAEARRSASASASSRWMVSTSATGAAGASRTITSTGYPVVAAGADGSDWEDDPMIGITIYNKGRDVKTEYTHRLPVRVALKAEYAFNERWSIESGLTFTRLCSDMKDGTKENYFTGEQKLNYLGIPVNLKYNACSYGRLKLYGSAGVLVEKCVSGDVTKEYVLTNTTKKTERLGIDYRPLQMSVGAALGVQLDVLDNIGIYAEPGVNFYFDDRSPLQTIYKEKPLNFNFNVGVRYAIGK